MQMQIKIPQPDESKINHEKIQELFKRQFFLSESWKKFQKKQSDPEYKSWEDMRYSTGIPPELNPEEAYVLLSTFRITSAKKTPILDKNEKPFVWEELSRFRFFCDDFAKNFGVHKTKNTLSEIKQELRRKRIFEGTVEEAIASSQIEGAVITRKQGKELLQSGRTPKTDSEKMVVNNYETIVRIENEWKYRSMSEALLLEIQQSLTHGTLKNPAQEGRYRTDADAH